LILEVKCAGPGPSSAGRVEGGNGRFESGHLRPAHRPGIAMYPRQANRVYTRYVNRLVMFPAVLLMVAPRRPDCPYATHFVPPVEAPLLWAAARWG